MDTQIGSGAPGIAPATRCVVVVPCYTDAPPLQRLSFSDFPAEDRHVDFLFVNDGSRDGTLSVLESLRAKHPDRIQVLDKQPNGGKAEAVRSGMLAAIARGDVRVTGFWDADLATPLNVIPHLLNRLIGNLKLEM